MDNIINENAEQYMRIEKRWGGGVVKIWLSIEGWGV